MNIGDLLIHVLADMKDFQTDVVKKAEATGDVAGQSMGQRIGAGVKKTLAVGIGVAAGAAALAFGVAAKGALELENATARFRAETGATADEAERMGKAINRVAGEEQASLQTVTDVAIKVHNDMGLAGDAADAMTSAIVRFSRVTRQDAVAATTAFDDILDAWHLKASDATVIMDKLVVSQQRYGGSVTENQAALAKMAPQLQALNASYDDGIGLLNLFATTGLDAASAQKALNAAVKNLKPGETLNSVLAKIAAIPNATDRAQAAIKVFGAKAGVGLANALQPGFKGLQDFEVSATDAAGATNKAADIIDSTFTGRIQKAISVGSAAMREFGASFGPAVTGLASLSVLFAGVGGGKLTKALLGPLVGLGGKFKTAIVKAILSAVIPANAAGVVVGEAEAAGVAEGMQSSKAMGIANRVLGPIGKIWGSILGKAFVLGALAVIGVELWDQLQKVNAANESQVKSIGENIGKQIGDGTIAGLQQSRDALEKAISDLNGPLMLTRSLNADTINALQAQLDKVNEAIAAKMTDFERTAHAGGDATATAYVDGIESQRNAIEKGVHGAIAVPAQKSYKAAIASALDAGGKVVMAYAQGILDAQSVVGGAFAALQNQQATELTKAQEQAKIVGILTSKALASGLKDGRAGVRLEAEQVQRVALERLSELTKNGGKLGKDAGKLLANGLKSKNPEIRKVAEDIRTTIQNNAKPKPHALDSAAFTAGKNAAAALKKGFGVPGLFASITVQSGPNAGFKRGFASGGQPPVGLPSWVGEHGRELFVPSVPGTIVPHMQSESLAAGGNTFHITVNPGNDVSSLSARRFGQSVLDVVAEGLREQTARGTK